MKLCQRCIPREARSRKRICIRQASQYRFAKSLWVIKTDFRNWDLLVLGSPTMQMLISPRRWMPSCVCLCTPPMSCSKMPFLTMSWPTKSLSQPQTPLRCGKTMLGLTIDSRSNTLHQSAVDIIRHDHSLELVTLCLCQRVHECVRVFLFLAAICTDITTSLKGASQSVSFC